MCINIHLSFAIPTFILIRFVVYNIELCHIRVPIIVQFNYTSFTNFNRSDMSYQQVLLQLKGRNIHNKILFNSMVLNRAVYSSLLKYHDFICGRKYFAKPIESHEIVATFSFNRMARMIGLLSFK